VNRQISTPNRGFRLTIERSDSDTYGLKLEETNGRPEHTTLAARLSPDHLAPFLQTLRVALRESGHPHTVVGPSRKAPVVLAEPAGVRFALAIKAAAPLNRPSRRQAVLEGIAAMSDEEAYYWYAKTTRHESGARALRALRVLLADDGRTGITA
jgi:hypothetical protein